MAFGDHRGSLTASVASVTNPTDLSGSVASVAVGDLIFGVFAQQTALTAGGTVTDNLGNTYSYVNAGTDYGTGSIRCFYARVTVAGTLTTISVPATASANDASAVASVIEGPFAVSPLDANPANLIDADGDTPYPCPATGVLAQADEVVMAAIAISVNGTVTATAPGSITQTVARANISCGIQRRVVSATTSVTPEFATPKADAATTTASFKKAATVNTLTADSGSFLITGTAATLTVSRLLTANSGSYSITGTAASLIASRKLVADAGSYVISGTAATFALTRKIAADSGSFVITGTDANLLVSRLLTAAPGSYSITGTPASLLVTRLLTADPGSYLITGTDADLQFLGADEFVLVAEPGSFLISGTDADLLVSRVLSAGSGSYLITGTDVTFTLIVPTDGGDLPWRLIHRRRIHRGL